MIDTSDLTRRLQMRLSPEVRRLLQAVRRAAEALRLPAYAVGGFVRDLLLGTPTSDVDIVVEGDGPALADHVARREGRAVLRHTVFGTATMLVSDGLRLDIATARRERYRAPAALPTVEPASISEDLRRRDFTINAMAIRLDGLGYGTLHDVCGGREDLARRVIRVLHAQSFLDDPTRAFRAVRYEQRLGFHLDPLTRRWLAEALAAGVFEQLSGHRLLHEVRLGLSEPQAAAVVRRWGQLGLLATLHPALRWSPGLSALLAAAPRVVTRQSLRPGEGVQAWEVAFLALLNPLPARGRTELCRRLPLPRGLREICTHGLGRTDAVLRRLRTERRMPPSEIYDLLWPSPLLLLMLWLAMTSISLISPTGASRARARGWRERARTRLMRYVTTLRTVRPAVSGADLKRLGLAEGPEYRRLLSRLLHARLDGRVRSKAAELALIRLEIGREISRRAAGR